MGPVDESKDPKHASYEALLEQYVPFVKKLDSLGLGYIQMMRTGFGATKYDEEQRGYEDLDIFKDFRPLVKNAKVCIRFQTLLNPYSILIIVFRELSVHTGRSGRTYRFGES